MLQAGSGGEGSAHLSWFSGERAGEEGGATHTDPTTFASGPTDEIFDFL
jgi:hypothetical protein